MKYLIVNADDFGLSPGVNRGICRAHDHGIVTSASLMVRRPAAADAVALAADRPNLSVGLHLDLGEWCYRDGQWTQTDHVVPLDDPPAIAAEIARQIDAFRELTGNNPTHLDSHQHVHRHQEPARSAAMRAAEQIRTPLRHFTPLIRYCGDFYGQGRNNHSCPEAITPQALERLLASLPSEITELACHPGEAEGDGPTSDYHLERTDELATLCSPKVLALVQHHRIRLISFRDLHEI